MSGKTDTAPKVSIIVPVYNIEAYLTECVESLLHQTETEIEIILVDDGSSDGSAALCDAYAEKDGRVRTLHIENAGVSGARNRGMEEARAEWLMFVDSDDWLEENAVELLLEKEDTGADLIAGGFYRNEGTCQKLLFPPDIEEFLFTEREYKKFLLGACLTSYTDSAALFPSALRCGPQMQYPVLKLFRRSIICTHGLRFPMGVKVGEDQLFNLQYMMHAKDVFLLNKPLYHYRLRPASATRCAHAPAQDVLGFTKTLDRLYEELGLSEELLPFLYARISLNVVTVVRACADAEKSFKEATSAIREVCEEPRHRYVIRHTDAAWLSGKRARLALRLGRMRAYGLAYLIIGVYAKMRKARG